MQVVDGDTSLEALNQDICGFLTCELYWTDPARSQGYSWWFYLLIGAACFGFICLLSVCFVLFIDSL
eukprot:m.98898 g.98898  ORF g.98898 m.98898 type:complete len:67 (+) comp37013_c0_seq26:588-788(+)